MSHGLREALRQSLVDEQRRIERSQLKVQLTASEYYALRKQVRVDVENYLFEHGPKDVTREIVARWVGEATKACLSNMVESIVQNDPPSPEILERARARIEQKLANTTVLREQEARDNGTIDIARHVPAAPSPSYLAKNGVQELEKIDIFVELTRLYRDANLMRASSVRRDADGNEKVQNPRVFDKSIARRLEILATSVSSQKELWDLQRMESFYNTIIETIAAEAPDVAKKIQHRLAELNIQIGMT